MNELAAIVQLNNKDRGVMVLEDNEKRRKNMTWWQLRHNVRRQTSGFHPGPVAIVLVGAAGAG